jgi:hypothetical protein
MEAILLFFLLVGFVYIGLSSPDSVSIHDMDDYCFDGCLANGWSNGGFQNNSINLDKLWCHCMSNKSVGGFHPNVKLTDNNLRSKK